MTFALVLEDIKEFAEDVQNRNTKLGMETEWVVNDDCSVAIFFDGIIPYVEYSEITDNYEKKIRVKFTGKNCHKIIVLDEK